MNRTLALLIGVTVLSPGSYVKSHAVDAGPPPERPRDERLSRLAKLWGTVRYVHPFLGYKDLGWDAPLIRAIPKVEAAKKLDGEPVRDRIRRLGRYIIASTPQVHTRDILDGLLGGYPRSKVTVTVLDRDRQERERSLIRSEQMYFRYRTERASHCTGARP
jgi:hypothetical protein